MIARLRVDNVILGIGAGAGPVRATRRRADRQRGDWTLNLAHDAREEHRSQAVPRDDALGFRVELRSEVDEIFDLHGLTGVRWRLGWEWLRRRRLLHRHIGLRHLLLFDRPYGLTGDAIEHVKERLLARERDGFDRFSIHVDVEQNRR